MVRQLQYQGRVDSFPPAVTPRGWETIQPTHSSRPYRWKTNQAGFTSDTFPGPRPATPSAGFENTFQDTYLPHRRVIGWDTPSPGQFNPLPYTPESQTSFVRKTATQVGVSDYQTLPTVLLPPVTTVDWYTESIPYTLRRETEPGSSEFPLPPLYPILIGWMVEAPVFLLRNRNRQDSQTDNPLFVLVVVPVTLGWPLTFTDSYRLRFTQVGLSNLPLLALPQPKLPDGWQTLAQDTVLLRKAPPDLFWYPWQQPPAPPAPPFTPGIGEVFIARDPGRHFVTHDPGRHFVARDPGRHFIAKGP